MVVFRLIAHINAAGFMLPMDMFTIMYMQLSITVK